ncbi:MAG: glucosaminidase domain-containing protein [Magnetospirillum sp. WYHS-4]
MMSTFERAALALVGLLVLSLMGAVYVSPPDMATASPRAVLHMAASAMIPTRIPFRKDAEYWDRRGPGQSSHTLANSFRRLGYDFEQVKTGQDSVPRVFLANVPTDLDKVRESDMRKALFIQMVLPLVLEVNEEIEADRARLLEIAARGKAGQRLDAIDRLWLTVVAERYEVERDDIEGLLERLDIVPVSLAVAQAAAESGWGTSRFVREGNALFGQWTTETYDGLTPKEREDGASHKVRAFDSLSDSARSYVHNLNTHKAYQGLRKARAAMRDKGETLSGHKLAAELIRYSERGLDYVADLRNIMSANDLGKLDKARLREREAGAPPRDKDV